MTRDETKKQYLQVIAGDQILVTKAEFTGGAYKNGDTGVVREVKRHGVWVTWPQTKDGGEGSFLYNSEYEIIGA